MTKHADGADESTRVIRGAHRKIEPSFPLNDLGLKEFEGIIAEKAKADWTAHEITMATILAGMLADIASDVGSDKTATKVNATISIRRSLGIHSPLKADSRDLKKSRDLKLSTEQGYLETAEDDLIARPH
jgi:hypothetical protein